ncbi:hypothetical protein ON010_g15182 [Phytophthora cinnamomi]|nr:hypothetical protein ON010_g15182 [Phytophthora cinnamomi]
MESSSDDDIEEFAVDEPPAADSGVMKLKDDPAFENMDPEGPSPNATGAASSSPAAPAADRAQPPLPPGLPPPPPARPAGGLPPPPVKRYGDSDSDFDSD